MARRSFRPPAPAVVAAVVAGVVAAALAGCCPEPDDDERAHDPAKDTSVYDSGLLTGSFDQPDASAYEQHLALADGRRIRVWISRAGDRLVEQHYSPTEDAWTAPATIFASPEPDPCQGLEIVQEDGIVAVAAAFGRFCYLGEDVARPVVAVATGDLTDWETHLPVAEGEVITIDHGGTVTWAGPGGMTTWTRGDGFAESPDR